VSRSKFADIHLADLKNMSIMDKLDSLDDEQFMLMSQMVKFIASCFKQGLSHDQTLALCQEGMRLGSFDSVIWIGGDHA